MNRSEFARQWFLEHAEKESRWPIVFEDGRLILRPDFSGEGKELLLRGAVKELVLIDSSGFLPTTVDFLRDCESVTRLICTSRFIIDDSPISDMYWLTSLGLDTNDKTPFCFSKFKALQEFGCPWNRRFLEFLNVDTLRCIAISNFPDADFSSLKSLPNLNSITFYDPKLEKLSGLAQPQKLTTLNLIGAHKIRSLEEFSTFNSLDTLRIEGRQKFSFDISSLSSLKSLRRASLEIRIKSLAPLLNLESVEYLDLAGVPPYRTHIEDGDIACLLALPNLKDIRFIDRAGQNMKLEEFRSRLAERDN